MAFTTATSVLIPVTPGAPANKLWFFSTADAITDLDAANYWAGAYQRGMRAGDAVVAICSDGGVVLHVSALTATTSTAAAFA